ncbi:MAG: hypothetical protein L3K26_13010 [Candidatus Hydrogenedentes bacterium]|nr:hypothetical protein [Candidatus Hydrogenedentota bacterium]
MKSRNRTKLVHEGQYVAEVEVELLEAEGAWSPYLSVEDAYKLDDIREALRAGNIIAASKHSKVYTLTPVAS